MWLSGRRAFRPDSQYYRRTRKLGRSRHVRASAIPVVAVLLALVILGLWWMLKH
jgi:hypothetical protein